MNDFQVSAGDFIACTYHCLPVVKSISREQDPMPFYLTRSHSSTKVKLENGGSLVVSDEIVIVLIIASLNSSYMGHLLVDC